MPLSIEDLPTVCGKYTQDFALSSITWFRVGGPADVLFIPADEDDLAHFLRQLDDAIPVFVMGVGSNLLVRDGGIRGVVIKLAASFNKIEIEGETLCVGAGVLDAQVAKKAAQAGIAGLQFYRGIPGTIGGALAMNAGAYGQETKDVLIEAVAYSRSGERLVFTNEQMNFSYRHCGAGDGLIFTEATFLGTKGDSNSISEDMNEIMRRREESQPVKERTGGSTFANPDFELSGGRKSWQLIDEIGARGRVQGDAQVSEQHCNFMINRGNASALDLETLIESLRIDVERETGVQLRWEIKRVGEPA